MGHLIDWLAGLPPALVLVAVFIVPLLESSAFIGFIFPGEIAVLIGGVIANQGALALWAVIGVAAAGAIIGDSVGFEVGKHYGERLLNRLPDRIVRPEHVDRTKALLQRRGGRAVFIGRFTTALRVLVPGMAGMARMRYRSFFLFNALGGITWAAVVAIVGYLAGKSYHAAAHQLSIVGIGLLVVLVGGYLLHRLRRRPRVARVVDARLTTERWTGRPLTLALVAAGVTGWLFGGLTQAVVANDGNARDDRHWHDVLVTHRSSWLSDLAEVLTWLGSTPVIWAAMAIVAVIALRRRRYWDAAVAATGLLVGQLIRDAISVLVGRARPPRADWLVSADGYSFPSGHTTNAVLGWGLIVALAWPWLTKQWQRVGAVAAAAVIAVVVGATRAYLGVHWPSDVLGGWSLGGVLLTVAVALLSLLRHRRVAQR
jgi:undecaprenyl-diphosphatase